MLKSFGEVQNLLTCSAAEKKKRGVYWAPSLYYILQPRPRTQLYWHSRRESPQGCQPSASWAGGAPAWVMKRSPPGHFSPSHCYQSSLAPQLVVRQLPNLATLHYQWNYVPGIHQVRHPAQLEPIIDECSIGVLHPNRYREPLTNHSTPGRSEIPVR